MATCRGPLASLVVALATLTACSGSPTPPPPPPSSQTVAPPPVTTETIPANMKAPPVTRPLNASAFENEPCRSLTEAQQKQFGLDSGRLTDAAVEGKSCFYRYPDPKARTVSVVFASKSTNGLSTRYIEHSRGSYDFWEPAEVEGYPGVGYDPGVDVKFCSFAIGLTDSLFFWVTASDMPGAARCSTAKAVATAVLTTIKAGQ